MSLLKSATANDDILPLCSLEVTSFADVQYVWPVIFNENDNVESLVKCSSGSLPLLELLLDVLQLNIDIIKNIK